jgi:hypothetical protein
MEGGAGSRQGASPEVDEVELEDPRANASVMLCSTSAAARSELTVVRDANTRCDPTRASGRKERSAAPVMTNAASCPSFFLDASVLADEGLSLAVGEDRSVRSS